MKMKQVEPKDKEYQIPFVPAPEEMESKKISIPIIIKEKEPHGN